MTGQEDWMEVKSPGGNEGWKDGGDLSLRGCGKGRTPL